MCGGNDKVLFTQEKKLIDRNEIQEKDHLDPMHTSKRTELETKFKKCVIMNLTLVTANKTQYMQKVTRIVDEGFGYLNFGSEYDYNG